MMMKKIINKTILLTVIGMFYFLSGFAMDPYMEQQQYTKTNPQMQDVFGNFSTQPTMTPALPFNYTKGFGGGENPPDPGGGDEGGFDPLPDPIPVNEGWHLLLILALVFATTKTIRNLKKQRNMKRIAILICIIGVGIGSLNAQKMVLRTKWDSTYLQNPSSPWVVVPATGQSGTYLRDDIDLNNDGTKLYVLRRNGNPGAAAGDPYSNNILEIWNPANGTKTGSAPNKSDPTNDPKWPAGYGDKGKAVDNYFRYGGSIAVDETGAVWVANVTATYREAAIIYRYTNDSNQPTLMAGILAHDLQSDGVCRLGYGIHAVWNDGNGYVIISHSLRDEIIYLPLRNGTISNSDLKRLKIPSQPAIDNGLTLYTPENRNIGSTPKKIIDGVTHYGIVITVGDTIWRTFSSYYGEWPKMKPSKFGPNSFWYDASEATPLLLTLNLSDRFSPSFSAATFVPFKKPAPVIIDSINKMACGAENFIFKNKNYLFLGTNNHNSAAMYIAKNMHQLYELSGASTIDSIIVNSKVANVPTHRGGMGGQVPDNAATVHGFQVNETSTTAPHNVHLYAFTGANGAIAYVMEEEVTFGLIGDEPIVPTGWNPNNPTLMKHASGNIYYKRVVIHNNGDPNADQTFTIMHKNKQRPDWNIYNNIGKTWATATLAEGAKRTTADTTIFEPLNHLSEGSVIGVVVKYNDNENYTAYCNNNSYTVYVDSIKYRLKVDVNESGNTVTYTSNTLFDDGTFSIYTPQNADIFLQGWFAGEWVNIGEPIHYPTDSTVITVPFTIGPDGEILGTPQKYEYPDGFYIRTAMATGGTANYLDPTKNNRMIRFGATGIDAETYYWVTDIPQDSLTQHGGSVTVRAVIGNVYNPNLTNWETTHKNATSASAMRYIYSTRTNRLERAQAKNGTITCTNGATTTNATTVDAANKWENMAEIANYTKTTTTLGSTTDSGLEPVLVNVPEQDGFDNTMTLGLEYDFKTNRIANPQWIVRTDENYTVTSTKSGAPAVTIRNNGQITGTVHGTGNITIEKSYNLVDSSTVNTRNYWISFPFNVVVADITGDSIRRGVQEYDLQSKYGTLWQFQEYDTYNKGLNNGGASYWVPIESNGTLQAGKGYVLQFSNKVTGTPRLFFHSASGTYTVNGTGINTKMLTPTSGSDPVHQNWYLIGNPFFAQTKIIGGPLCLVRVNSDYSDYQYYLARNYQDLKPFESFFVQYAHATVPVSFNNIATDAPGPAPALTPLKSTQVNDEMEFYELTLTKGEYSKMAAVVLGDDGDNNYTYGRDMVLMPEDNSALRFYSVGTYKQVVNYLKRQSQIVPLGYTTQTAGSYTIALANNDIPEDSRVTLYDAVKDRTTDLLTSDYTFNTETGTFDNRFTLYINKSTTDCNQIFNPNLVVRQEGRNLVVEGVVAGEDLTLFHVSGKCMAHFSADNTTVTFYDLTSGMYLLRTGNDVVKVTIK
jgi:hypothetical protein